MDGAEADIAEWSAEIRIWRLRCALPCASSTGLTLRHTQGLRRSVGADRVRH